MFLVCIKEPYNLLMFLFVKSVIYGVVCTIVWNVTDFYMVRGIKKQHDLNA